MSNNNWKTLVYLIGAIAGIATGLMAARMYTQSVESNRLPAESGKPPAKLEVVDVLKLGIAIMGLVRQISDLGARSEK